MIYKFTYYYNNKLLIHTCKTLKEADYFFNLLLSLRCNSIRIDTQLKHHF